MRKTSYIVALLVCVSLGYGQTAVQTPTTSQRKLAFLIPGLLDDVIQGLPSSVQDVARSVTGTRLSLASMNSGLAAELSNLPATSSASALRYVFDSSVGAYVPTQQSLGPVLTERAETVGKDKVFFSVTYQRFQFDHQDGLDLRSIKTTFPVSIPAGVVGPVALQGVVDATASLSVVVNEVTAHFTYGLTPWMDVSYAFPILSNSLSAQTSATFAVGQVQLTGIPISRSVQGSSTGLGDGVARFKAKFLDRNGLALAFATDVRLPIGDEFNLQGAGAFGVKPLLIASYTSHAISPHINLGYQWNGSSFLASTTTTEKRKLPAQAFYSVGADIAISKRMTAAFDVLDQIILRGPRVRLTTETVGNQVFRSIDYPNKTRHEVNGAAGFKVQLNRELVLTGNLLFKLNDAGLRSRVVPLVGVSYVF